MRNSLILGLSLVLVMPVGAFAQETGSVTNPPVSQTVVPPAAEKPKPVEKPRPPAEITRPVEIAPPKPIVKPVEVVAPVAVPTTVAPVAVSPEGAGVWYSFGCLALSFAMLIIGVAVGFVWRHLMSRRKLGGMTVRIGTWRGIP